MSGHSTYEPKTAIERWLDARLPIARLGWDSFVDALGAAGFLA